MSFEFQSEKVEPSIAAALAAGVDQLAAPALVSVMIAPAVSTQDHLETTKLPRLGTPKPIQSEEALELLRTKVMLSPHDIAHLLEISQKFAASQEIGRGLESQIFIDSSQNVSRAAERLRELTVEERFKPGPLIDNLGLVQAGMNTSLGTIVSCLRKLGIVAVGVIAPRDWEARNFVWRLYYQEKQ